MNIMKTLIAAGLIAISCAASAVTVKHIQWRVYSPAGGTPANSTTTWNINNPLHQSPFTSALPYYLGDDCVFAIKTMHLSAKAPSNTIQSYLLLNAVASVNAGNPATFDPPLIVPFSLGVIQLINNWTHPQHLVGIITGWEICGLAGLQERNAYEYAHREGLVP